MRCTPSSVNMIIIQNTRISHHSLCMQRKTQPHHRFTDVFSLRGLVCVRKRHSALAELQTEDSFSPIPPGQCMHTIKRRMYSYTPTSMRAAHPLHTPHTDLSSVESLLHVGAAHTCLCLCNIRWLAGMHNMKCLEPGEQRETNTKINK